MKPILAAFLLASASLAQATPRLFTCQAPAAGQVFLAGEMTDWDKHKIPMQKAVDGSWKVEVDLGPGQWLYKFVVDGQWIFDPAAAHAADGFGGEHSFLFMGEGEWEQRPSSPKGEVKTFMVPSAAWGKAMKVNGYFPPGYRQDRTYPVLMLLHGKGMDADQWSRTGQIQNYMDNLLAEGALKPFVIVMPSSEAVFYTSQSEKFITVELKDWLGQRFGLHPKPAEWAVAGMSMGGFGAFYLPFQHPDLFGFGFSMSAYIPWNEPNSATDIQKITRTVPFPFKYVFLSGGDDAVTGSDRRLAEVLKSWGAPFYYREDPGGHTWNYWSRHTVEMLETVHAFFNGARVPENAKSLSLPKPVARAPWPVQGRPVALTMAEAASRLVGSWRGEWLFENGTARGRYEQEITSIDANHMEGRWSVLDTGSQDRVAVPFRARISEKDGNFCTLDADGKPHEVIFSTSGGQLWKQEVVKVNGENIVIKVKKQ